MYNKSMKINNREEFLKNMQKVVDEVSGKGEYNVYLHHIWPIRRAFDKKKGPMRESYEGIMRYGLNLRQPSFGSTLSYKGSLSNLTAEQLSSYFYYKDFPERFVVAFALPKELDVNGEKVDFSTPVDYVKYCETIPSSLADLLYDYTLPKDYLLFGYCINTEDGSFEFDVNPTFIGFKKEEENEYLESEVKKYFELTRLDASNLKAEVKSEILEGKARVDEDPSYGQYSFPDELDY